MDLEFSAEKPETMAGFDYLDDAYCRSMTSEVVAVDEQGGVILAHTPFYPKGGGQPGDSGILRYGDRECRVVEACYSADRTAVCHSMEDPSHGLQPGDQVEAGLDWDRRYGHMRVHSALHLLSVVLPFPVTGGQIGESTGRLDFDIQDVALADKQAVEAAMAELIGRDASVRTRWVRDEVLDAYPELVKTMQVKPPRGSGWVRLVEISELDLQPCGGTHVKSCAEIGGIEVVKIEKKGAKNRRVKIALMGART